MRNRRELLAVSLLIIFITVFGTLLFEHYEISPVPEEAKEQVKEMQTAHICVPMFYMTYTPPDMTETKKMKARYDQTADILADHDEFLSYLDLVTVPRKEMVLTDLGKYYITGYTSVECGGSTMTASGATVHKGNPTTCAIDPALWDFGDLFYIPYFDQVYVAEDTGSAVKGKHLDLYFYDDEYNYALSITGYYKVYSVEYVYYEVPATSFDISSQVADLVIGWRLTDEMKGIETDNQKGPCYG